MCGGVKCLYCIQDYLSALGYACIGGSADVVRQLMIYGDMKSRPSEVRCCVCVCACGLYTYVRTCVFGLCLLPLEPVVRWLLRVLCTNTSNDS